jgi:hypothetical protein
MVVQLYSTAFSAHSLVKGIEKGDDYTNTNHYKFKIIEEKRAAYE